MTGISAAHDAFSDVNARTGQIPLTIYVNDFVDWAAVNAHSHSKLRVLFKLLGDFHGAENRSFRAVAENKGATIARREREQLAFSLSDTELLGRAHHLLQLLQHVALLGDQQLRVADDVDKENVADLELHV